MKCVCRKCFGLFDCPTGRANRAKKIGAPLYCSRECSGLARRSDPKTDGQKKMEKAAYDAEYREKNVDLLKQKKKSYYEENREAILAKMTLDRPGRMAAHVEYCQRPEYVSKKREYDKKRRAEQQFGDFSEAFLVLQQVEGEILSRASRYEIGLTNGVINKAQKRRREL